MSSPTVLRETVADGKKFVTSVTDDEEIEEILKMIAKVDEVK